MKKIAIASDHAGVDLKKEVISFLKSNYSGKFEVLDMGPHNGDSVDYPDYASKVAESVSKDEVGRGILICGTGIGMSITANKFSGVRATLVHDSDTAKMSREHNDSNILVLGARVLSSGEAKKIVEIWLTTNFEGGRHQRRLDKITDLEK